MPNASKSNACRAWAVRRSADAARLRSPSRSAAAWITPNPLASRTPGCSGAASAWPPRSRSASSATSPVATDGQREHDDAAGVRQQVGQEQPDQPRRVRPLAGRRTEPATGPARRDPAERQLGEARRELGVGAVGAAAGEHRDVQRARRALQQRGDQHRRADEPALADDERDAHGIGGRRRPVRDGPAGDRLGPGGDRGIDAGRPGRLAVAPLGGGHLVGGDLAPERVDVRLRPPGEDRAEHALELVEQAVADRAELRVGDVDQPVEADVGAVRGPEVHVHAERPHRQVAVQPRRHDRAVVAPVALEQVQRGVDVRHERAPPHLVAAVAEHGAAVLARHVDVRDRRVRAGPRRRGPGRRCRSSS